MMSRGTLTRMFLVGVLVSSSILLAQNPVQDIDGKKHPNLAVAQKHVVEANEAIITAQKDNTYDMQGHAENARQHLVAANNELKLAAEAAEAAAKAKQQKK